MEIELTPEQEARLAEIAEHEGTTVGALVVGVANGLVKDDERFRLAVREGLAQTNAGDFIEEQDMDSRFATMMRS